MSNAGVFRHAQLLDASECEEVAKYILATEDEVKASGPDIYAGTKKDSLTGRYKTFNYLDSPLGDLLVPKLRELFQAIGFPGDSDTRRVVAVQCWANVFRKGEGIAKHRHNDGSCLPYLSANLFIAGPTEIGTTYLINGEHRTMPSVPGRISVFPDFAYHYVNPNPHDTPRISMAMDFHPNTFVTPRYHNIDPNETS